MQIVNGYVCFNCTDEANAKKDIDPAHPTNGPAAAGASPKLGDKDADKDGATGVQRPDAVTFGGTLSALNGTNNRNNPTTPQRTVDISA